ncbi:glycosyltransferase [Iamia majanohamensis]|uniref:Glycosyltransferase n=1 Tax=Iamia majanohamensis TaxID=467976 RepID=A0AAE9YFW0_9ACTN|nr:glycosyltransferase [Iamia majanohamensis]WCO67787.1 glycosyltransferase [Iamia majanohamensis]
MTGAWRVAVTIPARDEADRIAACLRSVQTAISTAGLHDAVVVVVADHCTDATAATARELLGPRGVVVECRHRSVGRARAVAAAAALRRTAPAPLHRTWLATTDADTTVDPDWLVRQLACAAEGAAAVAGVVRVDDLDDLAPVVGRRWRAAYRTTGRSHPHVHGANLGVRADAYVAVGGWPDTDTAEDHGLWDRLRRAGWPTAASVDVRVTTSGRRVGRAPAGFAAHLRSLEGTA